MRYRSRTDIVSAILESANGGSTKTKIMYKAFLSYSQLKEYLSMLLQNGLLEYDEARTEYTTTTKGLQFLETFEQIGEMLPPNQPAKIVEAL